VVNITDCKLQTKTFFKIGPCLLFENLQRGGESNFHGTFHNTFKQDKPMGQCYNLRRSLINWDRIHNALLSA
jgi:hypothetical protein